MDHGGFIRIEGHAPAFRFFTADGVEVVPEPVESLAHVRTLSDTATAILDHVSADFKEVDELIREAEEKTRPILHPEP